jgi:hypothetical protein
MSATLVQRILKAHRAIARGEAGAQDELERLQEQYRTSGEIIRAPVGATAIIEDRPAATKGRRPISRVSPEPSTANKVLPFGLSYRDVELVERGYADFTVDVGSGAKETILGEISRAHREAGDVETAGWLFSQSSLRHDSRSLTVAYATLAARGDASTVSLGDPIAGIEAARSAGIAEHWRLCGDWHSHPRGGSELPSFQDAKAWAGTADWLARSCYVSLIVSPSSGLGWMNPKLSAWVARRHGSPSRPIVQRARMQWE